MRQGQPRSELARPADLLARSHRSPKHEQYVQIRSRHRIAPGARSEEDEPVETLPIECHHLSPEGIKQLRDRPVGHPLPPQLIGWRWAAE